LPRQVASSAAAALALSEKALELQTHAEATEKTCAEAVARCGQAEAAAASAALRVEALEEVGGAALAKAVSGADDAAAG